MLQKYALRECRLHRPPNRPNSPMHAPTPRRLTLPDSMILLAAVAIALASQRDQLLAIPILIEYTVQCIGQLAGWLPWQIPLNRQKLEHALLMTLLGHSTRLLFGLLLILTPAVLWLRLRQPRPPLWDLVRQPGLVACGAAALGYWIYVDLSYLLGPTLPDLRATVGGLVAVAWLGQLMSRRWRPEACWVDRLGRVVGFCWLATTLGFLGLSA